MDKNPKEDNHSGEGMEGATSQKKDGSIEGAVNKNRKKSTQLGKTPKGAMSQQKKGSDEGAMSNNPQKNTQLGKKMKGASSQQKKGSDEDAVNSNPKKSTQLVKEMKGATSQQKKGSDEGIRNNSSKKGTQIGGKMEGATCQQEKSSIEGAMNNSPKNDSNFGQKIEGAMTQLKKCSIKDNAKDVALPELDKTSENRDVANSPELEIVYESPPRESGKSGSLEAVEMGACKMDFKSSRDLKASEAKRSKGFKVPHAKPSKDFKASNAKTSKDLKASDAKILKRLEINKHANFMKDFDPERSQRETRKLEKLPFSPAKAPVKGAVKGAKPKRYSGNRKYDENGLFIETGEDLCDCFADDCPGCYFPCPKCRSCKCGTVCRRNRTWCYESYEIEGTGIVIKNKHYKKN